MLYCRILVLMEVIILFMWLKLKFMSTEEKKKYFFDNASPILISEYHYVLNDISISEEELLKSFIPRLKD